jgi:multiple sugar transport system substrate-binding protein
MRDYHPGFRLPISVRTPPSRAGQIGFAVAVLSATLAIAGCGGSSAGSSSSGSTTASTTRVANTTKLCSPGATKIQFWAWVPGISRAVSAFNSSHPKICVQLSDVGAGDPEYVKLTQALKAGSGAPDVAEVEYD